MKTRRVVIALTAILLLSVALNLLLFVAARRYYLQVNAAPLDPLGLSFYPAGSDPQPPTTTQLRVVFFGDSRAFDWPAPSDLEGFDFVNRGIGNQTTAQVLGRFDAHVALLHPRIVVLQMGINDLKIIPLFPDQKVSIVANCKANIVKIVEQSVASDATVILTTVIPLGRVPLARRLFWSDDVAWAIEDVNAFLRTLEGRNVIILDTSTVLADEGGVVRQEFSRDLLHLQDAGYEALNKQLEVILGTLGSQFQGDER
jgi:lysophospholipase L1-like esterase